MTTVTGLDDLKAHVGRRETADDVVTAAPANLLRLAFGRGSPSWARATRCRPAGSASTSCRGSPATRSGPTAARATPE